MHVLHACQHHCVHELWCAQHPPILSAARCNVSHALESTNSETDLRYTTQQPSALHKTEDRWCTASQAAAATQGHLLCHRNAPGWLTCAHLALELKG
jgi:hypothetical protein